MQNDLPTGTVIQNLLGKNKTVNKTACQLDSS